MNVHYRSIYIVSATQSMSRFGPLQWLTVDGCDVSVVNFTTMQWLTPPQLTILGC